MKGILITFEGPDASGKTTQIRLLKEALEKKGRAPLLTREPGGTPIGERIREILLDRSCSDMMSMTEMLLYAAARAQHVEQVIRPALAEGRIVISDRFTDSSIAYQGAGREMGAVVEEVNGIAVDGLQPDLTFLLLTAPESMRKRISADREDRIEAEADEFHLRVLEGFREIQRNYPERVVPIDGSRTIEEISEEIISRTMTFIKERNEE